MPARRRSLGVTDAYRRRMLEIRRKGEQMARQTWGDVDPEDLAGTFRVKPLANGVGTLQRTGVLLSQAYVQAFIKSEIGKDVLIPTPQGFSGNSFDDVKLRFALWRPIVLVRQLREQGVSEPEAMRRGRDTLLRSVSLATDGAVRDSLQKLYDRQPEIVGWKRAVKGTCDICMGAADGSTLPPGTPLDIHPNCECVSEGVIAPKDKAKALNEAAPVQIPQDLVEKNIYQWDDADRFRAHGFSMMDHGDAVGTGYNYSFVAKNEAGDVVGRLDVNTQGDEGVIGIIEVPPEFRRQGIAKKMLDYFRRYNPDMKLDWGYMTEDGKALHDALPKAWQ